MTWIIFGGFCASWRNRLKPRSALKQGINNINLFIVLATFSNICLKIILTKKKNVQALLILLPCFITLRGRHRTQKMVFAVVGCDSTTSKSCGLCFPVGCLVESWTSGFDTPGYRCSSKFLCCLGWLFY